MNIAYYSEGVRGVTFIVAGNRLDYPSSNPEWDC